MNNNLVVPRKTINHRQPTRSYYPLQDVFHFG
jgi:hypothetical protein